jgi:glycosyltransferase involved in cell wall biosynthesis
MNFIRAGKISRGLPARMPGFVLSLPKNIFVELLVQNSFIHVLTFICFFFLGIQLFFLGLFLYQFSKARKAEVVENLPAVSVIVCAHDEEENLRELIPLLLAQEHPDFELIIVEDRCNDGTFDYLKEVTLRHPKVRMVRVQHLPEHINGKKFALTLGIKAAQHDLILLTDADCRPNTTRWINVMAENSGDNAQIILGFSAYQKFPGLLNSFIRFETFLTAIQYFGFAWMGIPYMGVGRNLAYRKSLFLGNKGFNTHLGVIGGDDDLFVNQHATGQNTKMVVGPDALVFSRPKRRIREFYFQKLRHLSVGRRYKVSTRILTGFFPLSWIATWLIVLPAALLSPAVYWIAGLFGLRWILLTLLVYVASRRLGDPFEAWKTPFLDFIYVFYYLVAGTVALVSKKVRWKI